MDIAAQPRYQFVRSTTTDWSVVAVQLEGLGKVKTDTHDGYRVAVGKKTPPRCQRKGTTNALELFVDARRCLRQLDQQARLASITRCPAKTLPAPPSANLHRGGGGGQPRGATKLARALTRREAGEA
jgi:hypothetical protein